MKLRGGADGHFTLSQLELERVAPSGTTFIKEMQVVPGHGDALLVAGGAEAG